MTNFHLNDFWTDQRLEIFKDFGLTKFNLKLFPLKKKLFNLNNFILSQIYVSYFKV